MGRLANIGALVVAFSIGVVADIAVEQSVGGCALGLVVVTKSRVPAIPIRLINKTAIYSNDSFSRDYIVRNGDSIFVWNIRTITDQTEVIGVILTAWERDAGYVGCFAVKASVPLLLDSLYGNSVVPFGLGKCLKAETPEQFFCWLSSAIKIVHRDAQSISHDQWLIYQSSLGAEPRSSAFGVHLIGIVTNDKEAHRYQGIYEDRPEGGDGPSKGLAVVDALAVALGFVLAHKGVQRLDQVGLGLIALGWIMAASGLYLAMRAFQFIL